MKDFKIAIKADENSPEINTGMFTKSKMSVENKDLEGMCNKYIKERKKKDRTIDR